jgi:hypothetical protein
MATTRARRWPGSPPLPAQHRLAAVRVRDGSGEGRPSSPPAKLVGTRSRKLRRRVLIPRPAPQRPAVQLRPVADPAQVVMARLVAELAAQRGDPHAGCWHVATPLLWL